ncbi:MAG: EamA family transporter [Emergencia sp.]|nr:EamA family transporter [Emergencia sp.]
MSVFSFWWPIGLLLVAHTVYQVSAKSVPEAMEPFAAVFFNYVVAACAAFILWMVMGQEKNLAVQLGKMNWAPVVMGLTITAVEVASVFMYKLGWNISVGTTIVNIALAVVLAVIGVMFYKEVLTTQQLMGIGLCIAGVIAMAKS